MKMLALCAERGLARKDSRKGHPAFRLDLREPPGKGSTKGVERRERTNASSGGGNRCSTGGKRSERQREGYERSESRSESNRTPLLLNEDVSNDDKSVGEGERRRKVNPAVCGNEKGRELKK